MREKVIIDQCRTGYVPLSPIGFLERVATVHGDNVAIVYHDKVRFSWSEIHQRCLDLASAFIDFGISHGDIVATLATNIPAHYELHFGVPMAGAIISALNPKLDATTLALILQQLESCKLIFVELQFIDTALKALEIISQHTKCQPPLIVLMPDYDQKPPFLVKNIPQGTLNYNEFLSKGEPNFKTSMPSNINECDPLSVNFTSGSTGTPKAAVYSHRSTYLNSLATIDRFDMKPMPVFLWTVDMFRCNGWCFIWAMPYLGGTNICITNVSAKEIFDAIHFHKVTNLCGSPTLLETIANASSLFNQKPLPHKVSIAVAGILPPFQLINKVVELGFDVNIGYGMTETLGPVIVRPWKQNIDNDITKLNYGEQGLMMMPRVDVKDPETIESVPHDGKSIGEIMFKGNTILSGYFKSSASQENEEAFKGGWYRTGDLAVREKNGSFSLKDRAKDVIYSKGEVVSSLEVEAVLLNHPKVLRVAVVGRSCDVKSPCAMVELKDGCSASVEDIIGFCEGQLDTHMIPKSVVFGVLPLNSTGKVQKFVIREKIKSNNGGCDLID